MAYNFISIHALALQTDHDSLAGDLAVIQRELEMLHSDIRALNTMWEGSASMAYSVRFESDYNELVSLCGVMDAFVQSVDYALRRYIRSEEEVSGMVDAIQI